MDNGRLSFVASIDDSNYMKKLDDMKKGVNGLTFDKPIDSIKKLKNEIEEVNDVLNKNRKALTDLNTKISNTAPGQLKKDLQLERNSLVKSIKEDELALKSLNIELVKTKASHTTVNAELLKTRQQMQALALAGKTNTAEYQQLSAKAKEYSNTLKQVSKDTTEVTKKSGGLKGVFTTITSYFGVFAAISTVMQLIRGAFNTIVEFDSKLLNVSKTTGLAGQELKDLGVSLRALSQELEVVSVSKLTEYASVAGQLGVKGSADILAFSKALAQLEVTSNISGAEGGSQIARLLTLVDGGVTNVKAFGDEITRLGNNFPATEAEILKNSLAVAQNTGVYKLGRQEVLAYGTATKSIGVEAELTGASIGRTLAVLENSIRTGKNASNVMSITGKSVEDLKSQFKTDPQGVLYSFVKGLNDIDKSGGSVNNSLQSIGITAVRDQRVLGSLATGGFDVLTRALEDVTSASGAMQQEFETASGKIQNAIEGVKVSWENLVLAVNSSENEIGTTMSFWANALSGLIDWIARATTSWKELNRIASTKGGQAGFDSVMSRRDNISANEASYQAFVLEEEVRNLTKTKNDLEKELSEARWINKSKINEKLEKVSENLGIVNSKMLAYRNIANGIKDPTLSTTTTKTPEELESDVNRKKRESEAKRLAKQTESQYKNQVQFIDEVAKIERELNQSVLTGREEAMAKISNKYDDLIKKARELKVTETEITRINELRAKETAITEYRLDTTALTTYLEQQKKDYEAFEEYKKKVGIKEATEMYSSIIDVSKNYQQVLQDELESFYGKDLTDVEKERVNELFKLLQNYSIAKVESERKSLEELMTLTITDQERILVIQEEYAELRKQLESITNESIRNERLAILNKQEKEATSVIEDSIYQRGLKERQLIKQLTSFTRRELQIRLKSTEEYLNKYGEFLSEDQKKALESEADLLKSIIGTTDQISRQNALLKEKERITKAIKDNTSKDPEIAKKLNDELSEVNTLLEDNADKTKEVFEWIQRALQVANMLADAFGGANKELDRALTTVSNLVSSIAQGNMAGAVLTVVDWLIQGVKDVFGKDKEAERKRSSERRRNQEEYNKLLREQLLIETRINDAYQSRVQAIIDEQGALLKNREVVINRMKEILNYFNEMFNDDWAFINALDSLNAWNTLGMNEYFKDGVELSDELLNKLILLNSEAPLKDNMKDLYEELLRLRDEFGSVDEAVKQLEKELKDRLTGTTAQSLADSIREGIASGKRSFEDFADDIEGFLRNAILSGMSAKIIEPQIQQLQDLLYAMMKDGVLTEEERREFEEEYARIAEEAGKYLDLINQAGVNIGGLGDFGAGASDGIKRITETQADRLTGILTGMQVDVIESRKSLQISNNLLSSSLDNLIAIEFNTRATADNTYQMVQILQNNQQKALGL